PVGVLGALALELDQLTVPLAAVLVRDGRDADDPPDLRLAIMGTDEHFYELDGVERVGLGPPHPAVDLDAGGVDDAGGDGFGDQEAMEPEAVAAGLVAGDDRGIVGEAEAGLGLLDLGEEDIGIAGGDGAESGLLAGSDGEGELPGAPAQLQGEVEHG